MEGQFKKGDYVNCVYEGKKYTGFLVENPKKDFAKIRICTSSKRSDKPIFEVVDISLSNIKSLI